MRYYRRYSTKFYLSNDIRLNKLQVIWPITRRILFKVKYSEIIQMYNVFKYAFKYRCFFFLFPYFSDCKPDNKVFVKKIARLTRSFSRNCNVEK